MTVKFFGQYLLSSGWVTPAQLVAALEHQREHHRRIGEIAVERGYLTVEQADRINAAQAQRDLRFGELAVEMGLLESSQVDALLKEQRARHKKLGAALTELEILTAEQLTEALTRFSSEQRKQANYALQLPEQVPIPITISRAFDLLPRLLERTWNVMAKQEAIEVVDDTLRLSDVNAKIPLSGDWHASYILAVPSAVARAGARHLLQEDDVGDEEAEDVVRELANVLCGHLVGILAETDISAGIAPPENVPFSLALNEQQAVQCRYTTSDGPVFAAFMYPRP